MKDIVLASIGICRSIFTLIAEMFNVWLRLRKIPHTEHFSGKTVVFNTVRSFSIPMIEELFMARLYISRGCRCIMLFDDGMLEHWDTYQLQNGETAMSPFLGGKFKKLVHVIVRSIYLMGFSHKNLSIKYYSEIVKSHGDILPVDSIDISNAISSTRRFFEDGIVQLENPIQKSYYESSLRNSCITKTVAAAIHKEISPAVFVTSHGIYSLWGSAFAYYKNAKIPAIVYGAHTYTRQHTFISDSIVQILEFDSDWVEKCSAEELTVTQKKSVEEFFCERMNHQSADTKIYYGEAKKNKFEAISFPRCDGQKNICMFPNIVWDGDVTNRDMYFNGIVAWMVETIEAFKNSPHRLIIRFHPAEASLWKDSVSALSTIERILPDIYERSNVELVFSSQKIDTYSFAKENIDVALIYDGVLALEMPYLGIPVISPANGRFPGGTFITKPKNKEEYIGLLASPDALIEDFKSNQELYHNELLKYAYWFFFGAAYYLPILKEDEIEGFRLRDLMNSDVDHSDFRVVRTTDKLCSFFTKEFL